MKSNLFYHPVISIYVSSTLGDLSGYSVENPEKPWVGDNVIVIVKDRCKEDPIEFLKNLYRKELGSGDFKYQELIELVRIWLRVID